MGRMKMSDEMREYFSKLGKRGGKKGGTVRASRMTAEQRSEAARKAVLARWKSRER
jgi:hypothetical protein